MRTRKLNGEKTRRWAPTKKAMETNVGEIVANIPQSTNMLDYLNGKVEYMILKKATAEDNAPTGTLVRHGITTTLAGAKKEVNKLERKGILALYIPKTITDNEYDGLYLIEDVNGNTEWYKGLDAVIDVLNIREKERMALRKRRTRKVYAEGVMAFAYNAKINKWICTRLYSSDDVAKHFINKRNGIAKETIISAKAVKQYDGYHFKDERLDNSTRLKNIKAALESSM